jgi:8-oxo-dGTP diphosphatase
MGRETPGNKVAAAVLRLDGHVVLMVKRRGPGDATFWQLPGGGVRTNETPMEAVRRALREQTQLNGRVVRELFSIPAHGGTSTTFLVDVAPEAHPVLGADREAAGGGDETLIEWAWRTVAEVNDDPAIDQLKAVLAERGP